MGNSEARSGQGTLFKRNGITVAEIVNVGGPNKSRETLEVTRLSDTDGYRKFIGGLREPGNVTFTMHFTREGYLLINDDYESDDPVEYEIVLPDDENTSLEFDGLVTELPLNIPRGEVIVCDVTIKVSGKVRIDGLES